MSLGNFTAQGFIAKVESMSTRTKTSPSQTLSAQMRDEGRVLIDTGMFEINLIENEVTWGNDYAIDRSGYTLDQIRHMTVLEMVPAPFHSAVQDAIGEASNKRASSEASSSTSVWPMQSPGGKIIWWAVSKTVIDYPMVWIHVDHIQTTGHSGMSFVFMKAFMQAANGQTALCNQIAELKAWAKDQIERLDDRSDRLQSSMAALEEKLGESLNAAKEAAATGNASIGMMKDLKESFREFRDKYDTEIMKLIGTDSIHDKRIDAFEKHAQMITELAMKSIEMQAKKSSDGLVHQAEESSRGLSKKVVIPVSVIAGIVTILQVLADRLLNK